MARGFTVRHNHSLYFLVFAFDFLAGSWVPFDVFVLCINNQLADFTELALPANTEQGGVKVGVIFPQVFLLLAPVLSRKQQKAINKPVTSI